MVLSTDPAHSLSDSLGIELGPSRRRSCERLWGQEVQAQREMEANWGAVQRWLGADARRPRGDGHRRRGAHACPPGMDELFSLLQIKRHHESGEFDA